MNGKKAKAIRKLVYLGTKPTYSFVDENGTLQVDMLRHIYKLTKKYYKEGIPGTLPELLGAANENSK